MSVAFAGATPLSGERGTRPSRNLQLLPMSTATQGHDEAAEALGLSVIASEVNQHLAEAIAARAFPRELDAAIRYALLGAGKRLRPILVLLSSDAVGGRRQDAMAAAVAIEMIHCFSLVHDDLPAMDDDDLRRGRPTLHRHAGEAIAILAGDAMNTLAFEVIANQIVGEKAGRIVRELSVATDDMIAGQVLDTLGGFEPGLADHQRLVTVHRNKTAALLRASCRMGAICAGGNDAQIKALTSYGESIGLMFQAVDDLLDVTQTTEHLGKAAQKDAAQGKLTYPEVLGVEGSRAEINRLHAAADASLESLGSGASPLRDLCAYMAVRTR